MKRCASKKGNRRNVFTGLSCSIATDVATADDLDGIKKPKPVSAIVTGGQYPPQLSPPSHEKPADPDIYDYSEYVCG